MEVGLTCALSEAEDVMRRTGLFAGLILTLAIGSTACGRNADERARAQEAALAADPAKGENVTITGCLTAAADRSAFVVSADRNALTSGALYANSGETPTYTYELTGNTASLGAHVNQQVEVTGQLDEDRKDQAKVDDEDVTKHPEVQSGKDKVSPAIETDTEMNINVRRLTVESVRPTGRGCVQ
jgi:hypothetical protein